MRVTKSEILNVLFFPGLLKNFFCGHPMPVFQISDIRNMAKKRRYIYYIVVSSFIAFGLTFTPLDSCADQGVLKKVYFIPQWSPQAQFAGYYTAYEKGLYRKYGLDVTILQGGPEHSATGYLRDKEADFASLWLSTALQKRAEGLKVINLCQIIQKSALMLVAKKSSGINRAEDMAGKKVGIWEGDFEIQPQAFFKKKDLRVKVIHQAFSLNLFLRGGVDVASAMWYNEYHTIINSGVNQEELTSFFYQDYGLNFPEDGIYALEKTYLNDPELACSFIKASIEGWLYSFAHQDEALDIMLRYMTLAGIPANRMHQKWMLEKMKELIIPNDGKTVPWELRAEDFKTVSASLKEAGLISSVPSFNDFFVRCGAGAKK